MHHRVDLTHATRAVGDHMRWEDVVAALRALPASETPPGMYLKWVIFLALA